VSLERALELAERGRGVVEGTHPLVGAVLVRDGEVVGEGWYSGRGTPHAEAAALAAAGERARGATLYVSLEPCSHHGATPPCADAVVEAGVSRVVAAVGDPNPKVNGRGFARLREGGVEVEVADRWQARVQNEAWRVWVASSSRARAGSSDRLPLESTANVSRRCSSKSRSAPCVSISSSGVVPRFSSM